MRIGTKREKWLRIAVGSAVLLGATALVSAPKASFPKRPAYQKASRDISYVRQGLVVTITSGSIGSDGTVTARVKFADPKGVPLDKDGIQTPGVIAASAIIAYIPKNASQYTAYTTRVQTSPITGQSATQAGTDSGGTWASVAAGEYTYTFNTKLPANYDKTATHTIGVYASRDLTEFDLGVALDDVVYHFVPDGSTKPAPRDVVKTATCQRCHVDTFAFHGTTGRTSIEMCALCHTPQTTDPDTGNTVDLAVMVHKIHTGPNLPSVVAGGTYQIIGFGQSVNDYSEVTYPTDTRYCTVCHDQNAGAAQAANYLKPNRAACGSCHDDINFATGAKHSPSNLPQADDSQCSLCHQAKGSKEWDASVTGAHTVPVQSQQLGGIQWAITAVDNAAPGKKPTITFTLADKAGSPLAPSDFGRLFAVLGGPTTDYTTVWSGATTAGYVSEDVSKATGANGTYTYTFTNAIPDKAKGTFSVNLEGRRAETIAGPHGQSASVQYGAKNAVFYFSVDGSKVTPRRVVVKIEKCQACHVSLRLHGENRVDTIEHCVTCHNPVETDAAFRPAAQAPNRSVDFRQMIHNIHGGADIKTFFGNEDYVIFGFNGSTNNFSDVKYPGRLASCDACHVNDSQQLPLPATNAGVVNPRGILKTAGPESAACLSCHQAQETAAHALANTTAIGESCAACHGASSEFGVRKVHTPPTSPVGGG